MISTGRGVVDAVALARLRDLLGPDRVDAREVAREAYSRDLSALGHITWLGGPAVAPPLPDVVVRPADVAGVQRVVRLASELRLPVIPFGAGSGVCGGTFATHGGICLDLKGLDRVLEVDRTSLLARVEAGVNGQVFEDLLQRQGLTCAHFPSSITCSTVGGWVAARGAGQLSTRYGKVEDMVAGLEVVLADGTLVSTPVTPRAATGPDWNQLFTGCEGTLGIVVACTLRVQRLPALRLFRSWELPDLPSAMDVVREALQRGARPAAVRLYDPLDTLLVARAGDAPPLPEAAAAVEEEPLAPWWPLSRVSARGLLDQLKGALPDAKALAERSLLGRPELLNGLTRRIPGVGWLLITTFEGEPELATAEEGLVRRLALAKGAVERGPGPAETWWRNKIAVSFKQSGVYAGGGFVDTMEVATRWDRLEQLHDRVRAALSPHALVMAHFSHAYADGCSIYFTFAGTRGDPATTRERHRAAWKAALDAVVSVGAAVSHHHGVGLLKADALVASHGALHGAVFRRVKDALDPHDILNPGKLGLTERDA